MLKVRWLLLLATFISVPLSFVAAPYPEEMFLQHVLTVAGLAILTTLVAVVRSSQISFLCALAFV